jgi:8-oxo-dGTP pyrophosphatase MutT (NUDIX family)
MKQKTLSAGVIPVRYRDDHWEFLILRAFKYWDFPKGMVEEDEDPWDAAIRELQEETGLTKYKSRWGKSFIETEPYGKGKVARYYLVEITENTPIAITANPLTGIIEHHEYKWLTFDMVEPLLVPRIKRVLSWAGSLIF